MISIKLGHIPNYLRNSDLFRSLNHDDPEEFILVPEGCCKSDTSVDSLISLENVLSTIRYWGVHEVPDTAISYVLTSQENVLCTLEKFDYDLRLHDCVESIRGATDLDSKICVAVKYKHPQMLQYLLQDGHNPPHNAFVLAAEHGHVNCLHLLCSSGIHLPDEIRNRVCKICCTKGHTECLQYMHAAGAALNRNLAALSVKNGHATCLAFLHRCGVPLRLGDAVQAAQRGYLSCLELVLATTDARAEIICVKAAAGGHLACLKLAVQMGCAPGKTALAEAARNGRLDCMQFLVLQGVSMGTVVSEAACRGGHLRCLKYAVEQHCPVNQQCIVNAARYNHLHCMAHLHEKLGCTLDEYVLHAAVTGGNLPTLKYVYGRAGIAGTVALTAQAAAASNVGCLKYLREQGCPWDRTAVTHAVEHNRVHCLVYIYEQDRKLFREAKRAKTSLLNNILLDLARLTAVINAHKAK